MRLAKHVFPVLVALILALVYVRTKTATRVDWGPASVRVTADNPSRFAAGLSPLDRSWRLVEHFNEDFNIITYSRNTAGGQEIVQSKRDLVSGRLLEETDTLPSRYTYSSPEEGELNEKVYLIKDFINGSFDAVYFGDRSKIEKIVHEFGGTKREVESIKKALED